MIQTTDIINAITKFEEALPNICFPYYAAVKLYPPDPYDPKAPLQCSVAAVKYLRDISRTDQGGQIPISDYAQLNVIMSALNQVEIVRKMPLINDIKAKNPPQKVIFYDYLIKIYKDFQTRRNYITIPYEVNALAQEKVAYLLELYRKMPPAQQAQLGPKISKMMNVEGMYKLMLQENDHIIKDMISKWQNDHKDKGEYIKNVFIKFKEIYAIFDKKTIEAVDRLIRWANSSYDPKYIIDVNSWDQQFARMVAAKNYNDKINKQADAKKQEEADKAIEAERKAAIKQAADPSLARDEKQQLLLGAYEEMFGPGKDPTVPMDLEAAKLQSLTQALQDLPEPPTEEQIQSLKAQIDALYEQNQQLIESTQALQDNFSKT
jgi:hypothetical protein